MKRVIKTLTGCILLLVLLTGCSPDTELHEIYNSSFRSESSPYVQVQVNYDESGGIHIECHTDCKKPVTVSVYCDQKS